MASGIVSSNNDLPGIELADVMARLDGDLALLGRLLPQFIDASETRGAALRKALAAENAAEAGALLHQMKGSASSVGAMTLAALAARAEEGLTREGPAALADFPEAADRALDEVRQAAAVLAARMAAGARIAGAEHIPALLDFLKNNNLRALDVIKDCETFLVEEMGRDRADAVLAAVDGLDFAGAYEKLAGLLPAGAVR